MKQAQITLVLLAIALVVVLKSSIFIVTEVEQAVKIRLGKMVGEPIKKAGLNFKLPFIESVTYFDKRMLVWDGDARQVPTADKKYIYVDTTARWRIVDPKLFYVTVRNEATAMRRITSIIEGRTNDIVSRYNSVETVRNTNNIFQEVEELSKPKFDKEGKELEVEEKITGEIEPIRLGREKLSQMITEAARKEIKTLGIELIDVLIRRIAYEESVEVKVYDRMISERKRIAEKIRSIGKGEEAKIRGTLNLDLKRIESEAYRTSKEIKGKAEADAIRIYAESLKADPSYFTFIRTLEAYKKAFAKGNANFIVSTDSEFFKMLKTTEVE